MSNTIVNLLQKELAQEAPVTRKMLSLIPEDKWDWKPHEKSMNFKQLSVHLAEIPSWIEMAVNEDELDFAGGYQPTEISDNASLLALYDQSLAKAEQSLSATNDEHLLNGTWTMRAGDHIIMTLTKYDTIRHSLSQTIHHRAQLGVYLRLNNIALPITYGASADDSGSF